MLSLVISGKSLLLEQEVKDSLDGLGLDLWVADAGEGEAHGYQSVVVARVGNTCATAPPVGKCGECIWIGGVEDVGSLDGIEFWFQSTMYGDV